MCLDEPLNVGREKSNGFANFYERQPSVSHPVVDRTLVVREPSRDSLFAPQLLDRLNLLLIILHLTLKERRVKTFPFPILGLADYPRDSQIGWVQPQDNVELRQPRRDPG
jgi:hypothetical protein